MKIPSIASLIRFVMTVKISAMDQDERNPDCVFWFCFVFWVLFWFFVLFCYFCYFLWFDQQLRIGLTILLITLKRLMRWHERFPAFLKTDKIILTLFSQTKEIFISFMQQLNNFGDSPGLRFLRSTTRILSGPLIFVESSRLVWKHLESRFWDHGNCASLARRH